ncbi:MAG: hypothetical protein LIP09_01225 [Bacteroidales bacterium]|nr:hypothetical protein [Bacteroidales bacterium]
MGDILYVLKKIGVREFAINDEVTSIPENTEISLNLGCKFAYAKELHNVRCTMTTVFKLKEIQLLKATVETIFNIHPNSYKMIEKDGKTILPKSLLLSLASSTYGTFRGILFAKTEDSILSNLYLPLADMDQLVKSDLSFE